MRKPLLVGLSMAVAVAWTVTADASGAGSRQGGGRVTTVKISTRTVSKLGVILVNSKGRTLYMFVPDKQRKVTCVKSCAAVWPPVKLPKGAKAVAAGKARASLLASDANPAGGRVVSYNKWPLYTYVADTAPGQVKGQALNLNGGLWYVLSPSGKVIRTKVSSGYH